MRYKGALNILFSIASLGVLIAGCSQPLPEKYQGYVEGEFTYLASSLNGRLTQLSVKRGQIVHANQPLFSLEADEELAAKRQAEEQFKAAASQLEDIKSGKRLLELNVIQAQLDQAIAVSNKSAVQLKRDQELVKIEAISKTQFDESKALNTINHAKVRELKNLLATGKLPARTEQINAQQAQVLASQALVDQAQWRVKQKTINAFQDGTIYDTLYREGEWVAAGRPVVRMLAPSNIKIRFFVPESAIGHLKVNTPLVIHCDGCKKDISATLTYISNEAEYTPPFIYSNETRTKLIYRVEAYPTREEALLLHPGQPVEVSGQ